jgi:hypothetical protein
MREVLPTTRPGYDDVHDFLGYAYPYSNRNGPANAEPEEPDENPDQKTCASNITHRFGNLVEATLI